MSLDINSTTEPRQGRANGADGAAEARSWESDPTTYSEARNHPSKHMRLPRGREMTVVIDRVRARPAVANAMAFGLGQNAMGLGVWGTFFPKSVNRFLGMNADKRTIQTVFGLREFYTAFVLTTDPTAKHALWARVGGDLFDISVLRSLDRPDNPKRGNVRLALGVVLAVTAMDAFAAWRMSTVKRNCEQ